MSAALADRCATCGSPLAPDQHYCIACGERRGKARFRVEDLPAAGPDETPPPAKEPRRPRLSSGVAFIAGVATLLLAMGVGVLIGYVGNKQQSQRPVAQSPAQVVTVTGSGAAAGSGGAQQAQTGGKTSTQKGKKQSAAPKQVVITKQVQAKAAAAARKVLGGSAHLAPPTVTMGQPCNGAGCQGGKFTGGFFGQ